MSTTTAAVPTVEYVEFVFRVHRNGKRERFARQVNQQPDGTIVALDGRLSSPLVIAALREALDSGVLRRVVTNDRESSVSLRDRKRQRSH